MTPPPLLPRRLDATSCGLTRVPPAISQLARLKELVLDRNEFTAEGWGSLPRSLTFLSLKQWPLPELPPELLPLAASGARVRLTTE